jgi:hypothetical protein
MVSSGILRRVALVRTDVSEELSASFIRATRIGELGTTLALTSNRRTPHGATSKKTPFFIGTAVKTSNLTYVTAEFGKGVSVQQLSVSSRARCIMDRFGKEVGDRCCTNKNVDVLSGTTSDDS